MNDILLWFIIIFIAIGAEVVISSIVYFKQKYGIRWFGRDSEEYTDRRSTAADMSVISSIIQTLPPQQREMSLPGFLQFEPESDFLVKKQIAKGGSAVVFRGEITSDIMRKESKTADCIIKKLTDSSSADDSVEASFCQEVSMMWYFKPYPNFVQIFGFSIQNLMIVMKCYEMGSLGTLIHKSTTVEWNSHVITRLAHDIANGLNVMHMCGVVHSDVKPDNVLIERNENGQLVAVLSDLGIAKIVSTKAMHVVKSFKLVKTVGASAPFSAPEVFLQMRNDPRGTMTMSAEVAKAGDVFAYGVTLWEMITRKKAWRGAKTWEDIEIKVVAGERLEFPDRTIELVERDSLLKELVRIVSQTWYENPLQRLSFQNILSSLEEAAAAHDITLVSTPPSPTMLQNGHSVDSFM